MGQGQKGAQKEFIYSFFYKYFIIGGVVDVFSGH